MTTTIDKPLPADRDGAAAARDAMPDGGTLRIRTSRREAAADDETAPASASWVCLAVADTGIGMDAPTVARAFEPFFTTKTPGRGTGMGLATVHGIVTAAGGRVSVATAPGQGTEIAIDLPEAGCRDESVPVTPAATPVSTTSAPAAPETAGGGEPGRAPLILVAEDDPMVRAIVRRMASAMGYEVMAAASGEEALELGTSVLERLDLLLSDVRMPGLQGPQLARRMRELRPDLPVLFMSGLADEAAEALAVDTDGFRLLSKPFSREELAAAISETVAGTPVEWPRDT